mgnify:FL=1|jgi:hypothetical protein
MQELCQIKTLAKPNANRYNYVKKKQDGIMSEQDDSRKQNKDNGADALSTDYAVALGYDHTKQAAPKVLAKGQGPIAQKIVQIAIDEGIEIRRDADLVQILKAVDIDEEIPVEAFAAVAEIISYVYQVNNKQLPET